MAQPSLARSLQHCTFFFFNFCLVFQPMILIAIFRRLLGSTLHFIEPPRMLSSSPPPVSWLQTLYYFTSQNDSWFTKSTVSGLDYNVDTISKLYLGHHSHDLEQPPSSFDYAYRCVCVYIYL